jgi:hypothetical protein
MAVKVEEKVIWAAQPGPQTWLLDCPAFEILFGGARGGGKSDAVLGEWLEHADEYGINAVGLCVRRERIQLTELIERSKVLFSPLGATFHEQDKMWRFVNGARLRFAYLENDADAQNYQGHSYTRVYIEEMGTFPDPKPIMKLMATCRPPHGSSTPCKFIATANPGGPGHLWIKQRYIDPAPTGMKILPTPFTDPWTGEKFYKDRVFIPSKVTDNKYTNNREYIGNLYLAANNDTELIKSWLLGDWNVMLGAYFHEWNPTIHVIKRFNVPRTWTRFMSLDWGSYRPFSVGWWAVVPDEFDFMDSFGYTPAIQSWATQKNIKLPKGSIIRYRELYGAQKDQLGMTVPNTGLKLTVEEVAARICQMEKLEPTNELGRPKIAYRVADPSIFAHNGGPSMAERFAARPYSLNFIEADNKRVGVRGAMGGWDQVRARLKGEGGRPMMYFMDNCPEAIRTLPAMQHDEEKPEDVDTTGEDHAPDEIRYACMSRPYHRPSGSDLVRSMIKRNSNTHGIIIHDDIMDIEYGTVSRDERIY